MAESLATTTADRIRHVDLPLVDETEVDGAAGYLRVVEVVAGVPLSMLGASVFVAGLVFHLPWLAMGAVLVTALIMAALWDDTRLQKALVRARLGQVDRAEHDLVQVARSRRYPLDKRQLARTHLASIAWQRGDLVGALHWIRERIGARAGARSERETMRWLTDATHVQLLALNGANEDARLALAELAPPPRGAFAALVDIETRLWVAFAGGDVEGIRGRLDEWEAVAREYDGVGRTLTLLAWGHHATARFDRCASLLELVQTRADAGYLQQRFPLLWQWVERTTMRGGYARR